MMTEKEYTVHISTVTGETSSRIHYRDALGDEEKKKSRIIRCHHTVPNAIVRPLNRSLSMQDSPFRSPAAPSLSVNEITAMRSLETISPPFLAS